MNHTSRIMTYLQSAVTGLILLMVVLQLFVTNSLVVYGGQINQYEAKTDQLLRENMIMSGQIAAATSLSALETSAKELGFIRPTDMFYVNDAHQMALR